MDDLDPEIKDDIEDEDELGGEIDDDIILGKKKKNPKTIDDDSLDALADEEDGILPEDRFDDMEPEDLW